MFEFISTQILGMEWLNNLVGKILSLVGIDIFSKIGASLQFFIYDMIKILVILAVVIFTISYIQSYFPPSRTKSILEKYKGIKGNFLGAILGTVTPFCSCSSIPIFLGFTKAGVSLGISFSFLISSPLVDAGAIVLLMSVFGLNATIIYVIAGILLAVIGGVIIDKSNMESQLETTGDDLIFDSNETPSKNERREYAYKSTKDTVKSLFWYIVVGVSIGALIHNWIPQEFIENILGANNPFSVILATLVGIPVYADVFGTIPIAEALFSKGALIGTVLSFMMAVTTLSVPSLIMLKRALKPKLLALFVAIVTFGIIIIGYAFNFLFIY